MIRLAKIDHRQDTDAVWLTFGATACQLGRWWCLLAGADNGAQPGVPARYEVHLDRKLERTLAMLFRLRELRQPATAA